MKIYSKQILFIPARCNSKRFKDKLNIKLKKNTVIEHVIKRSMLSNLFRKIIIVTPDKKKFEYLKKYKIVRIENSKGKFISGTDRVASILSKYYIENVFILFADEMLITINSLKFFVHQVLKQNNYKAYNAISGNNYKNYKNTSFIKTIVNNYSEIINFKRKINSNNSKKYFFSVGLFCFKKKFLQKLTKKKPSKNQKITNIEQFKIIENSIKLKGIKIKHNYPSVNTLSDLKNIKSKYISTKEQIDILNKTNEI